MRDLATNDHALDHRLAVVEANPHPRIDDLLHEVFDLVKVARRVQQVRRRARHVDVDLPGAQESGQHFRLGRGEAAVRRSTQGRVL